MYYPSFLLRSLLFFRKKIPQHFQQNKNSFGERSCTHRLLPPAQKVAQGAMVGSCASSGIYYLNAGYKEMRHNHVGGKWTMQERDIQCYIEKRGIEFTVGKRSMIQATYLNGKGTDPLTVSIGRAENPDGVYTWDTQPIAQLYTHRRQTWRAEGEAFGYRLEIAGKGPIPVGITFTTVDTGDAY